MDGQPRNPADHLTVNVVQRDDPVSQVTEADAWESARRYPNVVLRGPVFGFAAQHPSDGSRWRLLSEMHGGYPQDARDGLNSHLWFHAKDGTDDPVVRRELLAAVALLETEPVNEVTADSVRYRVVRGDEFARIGPDGLEPPRPTDPEPSDHSWDPGKGSPSRVKGFVIDHAEATGLAESLHRMSLLTLRYTADRYPKDVREDSARAVRTHPGVVLLPTGFTYAEQKEASWEPMASVQPTPHDARRLMANAMEEFWPQVYHFTEEQRSDYAQAARQFREAGRSNTLRVRGRHFEIVRVERMLRIGPDGPERPRPSDVDEIEPMKMHPTMDEHGKITHGD
ncbi:DUF5954 family protein [Streptomyces sp. N2-109]|uniref:DUF5954 family protein n=1 Tax=Streptomyces gossypii TaxID=2883101 RepID=A0ABT2JVC1_9ACTN|nr:DUF5954 family protein [Streptomyces gossypii]MCT2591781.1 DUF5954 family protein [Streptomyces gossypii]